MLPRATPENFVDLRSTGSSFNDPSNSFHMLDEINNVDDEGYVPDYLTQDRIEGVSIEPNLTLILDLSMTLFPRQKYFCESPISSMVRLHEKACAKQKAVPY